LFLSHCRGFCLLLFLMGSVSFWWNVSLWLHYVTVFQSWVVLTSLRVLWYVFDVLDVLLVGLSCCLVGFLLWVFVACVGSPFLLYCSCCSSVCCWCGTFLMFFEVLLAGLSCFNVRFPPVEIRCFCCLCGLPSFVYSCLPSVCWCGCVASSGLVVGFLGLRSLLRWNLVTVRVFPLSFRVSEQFDTSQEVHAAAVSYSTHETICVTCLHIAVPESHISFQEQDWGPLPVRLWDVCCHHDQSDTL